MIAVEINNISFNYNQQQIFNDLCLTINNQEKVGIIGANGAGKTTLFLSICGILKLNQGEIKLFDKTIAAGKFHPEIGLVFQNPDDQLFCPTVKDDIIFGAENLGLSSSEIEARFNQVITTVGVKHLINRIPHQLSGGEKCMVAIASVLIMQPKIILYDEPSANLDLKARRKLIQFLQSSSETILVSAHDLELILEVCDRVIVMNKGKIVADGIPEKIMSDEKLMRENNLEIPPSLSR
ncbi:energy-coupling factor ABC transporter ATP-binding protein [Cyanobacterium aponinum UTEX 3222]|uniref:ATP-binding cassette domain-containing protein n=2 Tax=Cyanobacterium aponinum TaxID=379064 RepID=A0A844H357_9CHRO|nr:energy-coupling factor ABC transporter ATP-binding protein [Cyanobacterium aponinum]WRL43886.1 energy-coupling factor ABC transporter ATP-binding protein [Cyanobacterium aponinum UTEX 3222]MBD2393742.1 energy-coupling factor ABC transporter ATP-binding protein [Cyanobacterium aponinum FACHB-4101]MTF40596.1 ATP-binding cassette domain-containing protein [Cyanobacterium aponinum 0216]PHV61050.1 ABC transporter ATP-binding protein [Cyanobacterium aponinum IPPAS B-1201]WPF87627.1 energy-couplin